MTLSGTVDEIEKKYGKGSLMKLGDVAALDIDVIPTGNIALDIALGIGGYPHGRIVEAYGNPSGGKSTLALHAVAEAQAQGLVCAYIDAENALDPVYAAAIGVDIDELYLSQPNNGEEALGICLDLVKSGEVGLIVIDSVAALVPRAEIEGDLGQAHVGLQARLMGQSLRMMNPAIQKSGCTVFFINQIRSTIGGMSFGPQTTTSGGRALGFYASVRLEVSRIGSSKAGTEVINNQVKVKVVKNKTAAPFKEALFDLDFGEGISQESSLLDYGEKLGLVKKSGAWYATADGEKMGQGKPAAKQFLKDNTDFATSLYNTIKAEYLG